MGSAPPPPVARETRHGDPLPRGLLLPLWRHDTELHFLEAFIKARDAGCGRDFLQCRYRVTDEHGFQHKLLSPHAATPS
jgi:hypothetical protein